MSQLTVTRTLKASRERVWQVLTQPSHFEGWLPAKPGTAVLDVRAGGSWQATVISSDGHEIALTGRYDEVSEPDRLVMTVPGDMVTAITLTSAPDNSTHIAYAFAVDESMRPMVTESVDEVLSRVSTVLAGIALGPGKLRVTRIAPHRDSCHTKHQRCPAGRRGPAGPR